MFNKKLLVLILITVIFSISAVSAMDADSGALETNDDSIDVDNNHLNLNNDISDNNLKTSISDFDDLADNVNGTGDGETFYLESDYRTTNSSNQIIISKSITIDGQNHFIEAPDVKRVFLIEADNVCIKNINFINSKATGLAGGVISWLGNNGTLDNCNFTNNSASSAGGAVCWIGDFGKISNCNFENNDVKFGQAVSLTCQESFDPRVIHIQIVNSEGGALYIGGNNVSVDFCRFYNNVALLNGGAISVNWGSNLSISSSKFRNNSAGYNGGAIDLNGDNASLSNLKFFHNSPQDLFLNSNNATIANTTFKDDSSIDSWHDVNYENVTYGIGDFDELTEEISLTPEGGVLVLDRDYEFINGSIKGIVISKSITIDGAGHTLNGNKLSRIFNVTADNVTIKNVNFINGNALGSYGIYYGGGAIYWNGTDGYVENCSFTDNSLYSFENDPFDGMEIAVCEDGVIKIIKIDMRPVGATTSQGGAIAWIGGNGKVANSTFKRNSVGYANDGGAIFWAGANGKIINSEFYDNDAYRGAAIYWNGVNGTIFFSTFLNSGICDNGIFWTGQNGVIRNSILLSSYGNQCVISPYADNVKADFNFWGDTKDNPNMAVKSSNVGYWVLIDVSSNKDFVFANESFLINYKFDTVMDKSGNRYAYKGLDSKSGSVNFTSNETGILSVSYDKNEFSFKVLPYNSGGDFYDLLIKIHNTPEGGVLVLDRDYEFITGFNKGILISKSITIDGAGHTLNGNKLSRIFNITADDVTIKNVNFINGNAVGRYYTKDIGGGAIYWSGDNGYLFNCSFVRNSGSGIEENPFDMMGIGIDDDGMIWFIGRMMPMGAKTNEGGAIVWNGTNGTVDKCLFKYNGVGYPNSGGAICWRGDDGKVIASEFYDNDAWCGSSICWIGDNGTILSSIITNSSFFDGGIYWFGQNGTIHDSLLLDTSSRGSLHISGGSVNADYNFWGDTLENPNAIIKNNGVSNWLVIKFSNNGQFVEKGQVVVIKYDMTTLRYRNGSQSTYGGLVNYSSQMTYKADKTGYLKISFINGKVHVDVDSRLAIKSSDLVKYYSGKISYSVRVQDVSGNVVGKKVKFTINNKNYYATTNNKGVATLKINLKPGKYVVYTSYSNVKVKNKITVKTTLITKNLSKKVKTVGRFTVKVLNSKGAALAKKVVKINFKGKTFYIKTNSMGIATFYASKNLKVGSHVIKTTCNGLTNINKIIVRK